MGLETHPGPICPEPPPHCLSPSGLWTLFSPPKKHQFQHIPRSVAKKGEGWITSAPRPGTEVPGGKGFPLMLHSFGHCLPRGSEKCRAPGSALHLLGDLARSSASLSLGPNIPLPLLNRACCLGSWHSVLHLEVPLLSPPLPLLFPPSPMPHLFYRHGLEL